MATNKIFNKNGIQILPNRYPGPPFSKWQSIAHKTDGKCWYCGSTSDRMTIDHQLPKALGGTDDEDNLVPCCNRCNRDKGSMTLEEFREEISAGFDPPVLFYGETLGKQILPTRIGGAKDGAGQ